MSRFVRVIGGVAVAGAAALLLGVLSQFPVSAADPDDALLRLTWRLRSQETGECPQASMEALERLPPHMRNPDACVGPLPAYHFRVWLDGQSVVDEVVEARGVRGDRPLYVLRDLDLLPGTYRLQVEFRRQEDPGWEVEDMGEVLSFDGQVTLTAGTVTLLARAGDTGDLEIRRPR